MPVSICTQKEFLIESKLNIFWGVLLLLLDLAYRYFRGLVTGVCTCLIMDYGKVGDRTSYTDCPKHEDDCRPSGMSLNHNIGFYYILSLFLFNVVCTSELQPLRC